MSVETPREVNSMINKVGIYLTPIFAVAAFVVNCEWFWAHWSGDMKWGGMGLHPYLMSVAFILLNPLAVISFRLFRDILGIPHKKVMAFHGFLQTAALILACFAVRTMWIHMDYWSEDNLGSVHALMGMFMVISWGIHVLLSIFIFYFGPKWLKAAFRQMHMALGFAYSIGMFLTIICGIMYEEVDLDQLPGTTNILTYCYQKMKVGSLLILMLVFDLYLAVYSNPKRGQP